MGRKETSLTVVTAGLSEHRPTRADAPCLVCTLIDNDDDEPLRDRLARAMAYGTLVLAKRGGSVSTCGECHDAIADELDELGRELRKAKRAAAENG